MTVAVSAAASLFTVHSSTFTASQPTPGHVPAATAASAADAFAGIEPVAPRDPDPAPSAAEAFGSGAEGRRLDLSSLALELSRRAAGTSLDVPCTLTVPPPFVH